MLNYCRLGEGLYGVGIRLLTSVWNVRSECQALLKILCPAHCRLPTRLCLRFPLILPGNEITRLTKTL
jgi:hypothetical protein